MDSQRPIRILLAAVMAALLVVPAAAEAKKKKPPRPSVSVVKKGFTNTWDTEFEHSTGGPGTITLKFHSVKLARTRRSGAESIQVPFGTWITPAKAVFTQTIKHESCEPQLSSPFVQPTNPCSTYTEVTRVTALGNFYKSDFGWRYVPKGATTKRLSSTTT